MGKKLRDAFLFVWQMFYPLLFYLFVTTLMIAVFFLIGRDPADRDAVLVTAVSAAVSAVPLSLLYRRQQKAAPRKRIWNAGLCLWTVVLGVGSCFLVNNIIELSGLTSQEYKEVSSLLYQPPLPLRIAAIGIIIPVTEELIFRGLVFSRMRRVLSFGWSALFSAFYFACYHGNIVQGVYAFCLGLFMAALCEACGTLWAPICFHVTANLSSIVLTALLENTAVPALEYVLFYLLVPAVFMVSGVYKIREGVKKHETAVRSDTML